MYRVVPVCVYWFWSACIGSGLTVSVLVCLYPFQSAVPVCMYRFWSACIHSSLQFQSACIGSALHVSVHAEFLHIYISVLILLLCLVPYFFILVFIIFSCSHIYVLFYLILACHPTSL